VLELTGRADLHMHTTVSDGIATARQMLDYAAEHCTLDVLAITDHDRLEASLWAYSQRSSYPFDIIPGVEVTSADGHVLALWVTQPIPKGMSLEETVAAIHEQNGFAVLAHPLEPTIAPHTFWRYLRHPEVLIRLGIDAVEILNAGAFTPGSNWLAQRAYRDLPLTVTGSSDAHMPASIGTGLTRFRGRTAADLRDSLAHGWTAAEGKPWHITVYLKLFITSLMKKPSASLEEKAPSTHPTRL
jgi:predicted metal-dependent phosphoesterase TrpH